MLNTAEKIVVCEMISMRLSDIARIVDGELIGADGEFAGVSTDSRSVSRGELFIALRGEHFDGHAFVAQAGQQGAAAAMVDKAMDNALPQLVVEDTRVGLGRLAAYWRSRFSGPLIGLTGSNGKTTVKEILTTILAVKGEVLATRGNLNNDIGMPLTLLRLQAQHQFAVIEMGANHPGEIAYLTNIANPTVAIITNAGPAHLEGFGTLEGVAQAKGEIFQGLQQNGTAVINADDPFFGHWCALAAPHRTISFGLNENADVRGEWKIRREGGSDITLHTPAGSIAVSFALPGEHNVMNALAVSAAALGAGATLAEIKKGLEEMQAVPGRVQQKRAVNGATLIDDTYNANPASFKAAINVLAAFSGTRILVMGDMAELGAEAQALHEQIGKHARAAGIDGLYAVGEKSFFAANAFGVEGHHFETREALVAALENVLQPDVTVLVKGSRSARMEHVVAALIESGV